MDQTPWWVKGAVEHLDRLIRPEWIGWEWGGGGSTVWLGRRIKHLTTVEHSQDWVFELKDRLDRFCIKNVNIHLQPQRSSYYVEYAEEILSVPEGSLDFIAVDGRNRPRCLYNAICKLARGGVLLLDDSQREAYQDGIAHIPQNWKRFDYEGWWNERKVTTLWIRPLDDDPHDRPKRAVFWLCSDDDDGRYVREAHQSLQSIIANIPGIRTYLFLAGHTDLRGWDEIVPLPEIPVHEFWYLMSTRWFVWAVDYLAEKGIDEVLYLDTDTYVASPATNLYHILKKYEFAIPQSPQRDCCNSALLPEPPESFCTLENGVTLFRNTPRIRQFFKNWLARFEASPKRYDNNDCAPLRDELWENPLDIKWVALAPEFGLRFDFGCWVVGRVRILHGRNAGISTDVNLLSDVGKAINAWTSMRIWSGGKLITKPLDWGFYPEEKEVG